MKELRDLVDAYTDTFMGYGSTDARTALMVEIDKQEKLLAETQVQLKIAEKYLRALSKWGDPILVDMCKSALAKIKEVRG